MLILFIDHFGLIDDKQWQHYLMLSHLSDYHFLLNMLLIVISILQITVAKEHQSLKSGKRLSRSNSIMRTEHQNKTARSSFNSAGLTYETNGGENSVRNPEEGSLEGESFVDRVGMTIME